MGANRLWGIISKLRSLLVPTYIRELVIVFIIYFVAGYIGLGIAPVNKFATLVWAPTGIALSAMLLFGYRVWPAIFLGAFAVNFTTGASVLVACGIGVGNALEAVTGTYLLELFDFDLHMTRIGEVLKLIVLGAITSTLVSATIGVGVLAAAHVTPSGMFAMTWQAWWVGDVLGDLVVVPLVLGWVVAGVRALGEVDLVELLVWLAVVTVASFYVFSNKGAGGGTIPSYAYLIFPVFVWGATRLRQPFVSTGILLAMVVAIYEILHGVGVSGGDLVTGRLFTLQLFIGVLAGTKLILSAAVSETRVARQNEVELNDSLKKQMLEVERLNGLMISYIKNSRMKKLKRVFSKQDVDGLSSSG